MVRLVYLIQLIVISFSISSCGDSFLVETRGAHGQANEADAYFAKTISSPEFFQLMDSSFANFGEIDPNDSEAIWAVSQSQKFAEHKSVLIRKWALARGALPQILTPSIRQEIENNDLLQRIARMPDFLRSMLKFFVDDSYIIAEIQNKITSILDKVLKRQTNLHKKINYRFDHFLTAKPKVVEGNLTYSEFAFEEQFVRWYYIFSIDNFWTDDKPLDNDNHGIQLLSSLQVLSELQYSLGIAVPGQSTPHGGLSFDAKEGAVATPSKFDLRAEPDATRYFSGKFKLSYKNGDIVDIASDLSETWVNIPTATTLDEQAKLWMAGAKLFERLRPAHYEKLSNFYDHALCKEAFGMPLSILASMNTLLNGPFIDVENRLVRKYAKIPNNTAPFQLNADEPAGLIDMIRAAHAVYLWAEQLRNQDDLINTQSEHGLDVTPIAAAFPRLKDVLRLLLQSMLKKNVGPEQLEHTLKNLNLSELAEVIVVLTKIEKNIIQSSYLKKAIETMTRHFFAKKINSQLSQPKLSQADVAWVVALIDSLATTDNPMALSKEFADLHSYVKEKMAP